MRSRVTVWVLAFILMFSSLGVTQTTLAEKKPRKVPPSAAPVDGKKVAPPTERKDITPQGAKTYKKFLNPSGTITLQIQPTVADHVSPLNSNSLQTALPTAYPSIKDNISFVNTNGSVQSYPYPSTNFYLQNSLFTDPGPPPVPVVKQAESFVIYACAGGLPSKMSITEAKLICSSWSNGCANDLTVDIHNVGASWSSSGMTWATKPTMDSTTLITTLEYPTYSVANVLSAVSTAYYSGTDFGFGFTISAPNDTDCGISATGYPVLEITYAPLQGGSPSGNDLSFGNGAGSISVNSWTGATYLSQYDLGFSAKGGLSASFVRTYNSDDTVNYGLGVGWTSNLHQTVAIDTDTNNVTWRTGSGEYKAFRYLGNSTWQAPMFSRLTFTAETINSVNYYTITDKYGKKLCFDPTTGKLAMITNRYGNTVVIAWNGNNLTTVTDSATSRSLTFTYDQYNRLTDVEDPVGRTVSYTYDANSRLTNVTDPESGVIDFTYDATTGKITAIANQLDKTTSVGYNNGAAQTIFDSINQNPIATYAYNSGTNSTGITNINGASSSMNWNAYGYVTSVVLPGSISVSYARNSQMQITSVTDPRSNTTSFGYDTNGNLISISRPGSISQSFAYDTSNNLTSYTDARGNTTSFSYSNNLLNSITNDLGQSTSYSYTSGLLTGTTTPSPTGSGTATWGLSYDNTTNYPETVTSPAGREYEYTTDNTGLVQTYTDPMGNTWTYTYNDKGQLLTATSPQNTVWSYTYDAVGRLTRETDPLGGDTSYTYDYNGNLTKITNDLGKEVEMHRRADGKIDWVDDPMDKRTSYTYDTLGRVTKVTSPTGEETEFTYDNNSNILTVTDPRDKVTALTYDSLNRLTTVTDAKSHASTVEYNSNGAVTKITNAQSKYTEFSYDDLNRMWKVKNALGDEWTRTWNNAGKLLTLDGPTTAAQEFVYNIDGLMTNSEDSNAKSQTYEYNLNGNITSVTDPLGNESTFEYDTLNRLTKAYDPANNYIQNTYDAVGNVTTFRDRRGNEWDYEYDSIYRLTKITDPLNNVREYVYNDNSMVTQVKKPPTANPPTVNFGYDNSSRVNSFTDELGHSASVTYTNGIVSSVTDRKSQQFGFTYDDVGLLTQISMPNSQNITFEYDSLNRMTHFTDLVGTSDFTYDDIGRLTSTDDPYDFTHQLTYNSESMITGLSAEGDSRSYTWDTSGRMSTATRSSQTTSYTYNDASWVTKIDYPNSTNTNYTYNTRGWMTAIELKDSNNNTIFNLPYSYDANGNVTSETVGSDSISYTYDALNRLTFIDRPGTTNDTTYTYDPRGNRTQMQTGSIINYLTFNAADELTRVDKPSNAYDTYTYDNNGNCTSMNVFYPQPLLANQDTQSSSSRNNTVNNSSLLMTHYPSDFAPKPISKWRYLSPYLPSVADISSLDATIYSMLPDKANWDRQERWRKLCMPMRDPDETTNLTYSSDNNLTHVDLTNGNDIDFKYDAAGRRVEKKFTTYVTSGTTTTTTVTTYKYHYIGSQITTIEIDQTQTVDDGGEGDPVTTTTKDDEIRIHLGANSRPISFEYYTENQNTQQTTSATYYYHYDLHGNVIRVTNSSGTTVIQYTYDQLGTIVSETNANSIYNPFTYMGEAQIIHDDEFDTSGTTPKTGLYSSGSGYYNPHTGTFLGGSGAPASANPTSTSAEEPMAQSSNPSDQSYGTAMSSAKDGGAPGDSNYSDSKAGSSADVQPENTYDGLNESGLQTIPGYNANALPYNMTKCTPIQWIDPNPILPQPAPGRGGSGPVTLSMISPVDISVRGTGETVNSVGFGNISDDQRKRIEEEVDFWKKMYEMALEALKEYGVNSWEEFDQLKNALIKAANEAGDTGLAERLRDNPVGTFLNDFKYVAWAKNENGDIIGIVSYCENGRAPRLFMGPLVQHSDDGGFHEGSLWTGSPFTYGSANGEHMAGKSATLNPWCMWVSWRKGPGGRIDNNNTFQYANFTGNDIDVIFTGGSMPDGNTGYLRLSMSSNKTGELKAENNRGIPSTIFGNCPDGSIFLIESNENGFDYNGSCVKQVITGYTWLVGNSWFSNGIGFEDISDPITRIKDLMRRR